MDWRILISGLPGRMAHETVEELLAGPEAGKLLHFALSSDAKHGLVCAFPALQLECVGTHARDLQTVAERILAIDFSTPSAALPNAQWFCARHIPFVMGTTGGDDAALRAVVARSPVSAVIAPNMAAPIVLMLHAVEYLAREFPGALDGHALRIVESHQAGKRDTSGTARAMVELFRRLGIPFTEGEIERVRDPARQKAEFGVPDIHLGGHAYHDYTVSAADESLRLGLQHCVNGRRVYARGAVQALRFLAKRAAAGDRGQVYSMADVLRG